jgi:predicted SAM-dependent methyltransferase
LPYATGSVDFIYSSHTLEHLFFSEAEAVLAEAARVLKPSGQIRLALPDASQWARDLLSDIESYESGRVFNQRLLAHPDVKPAAIARLRDMAGGHVHRWQPTPALAEGMLGTAGFIRVRRCSFRSGSFPDLENVETREESFFVEAVTPE